VVPAGRPCRAPNRQQAIVDFVDRDSDLTYADWPVELSSIATNET
jgi:hypothetical protein